MGNSNFPLQNAFTQRYVDQGRAEAEAERVARGRAEGEANAVLRVLDIRGIEITAAQRDRITTCTDLDQLDTWLTRAITTVSGDELFKEAPATGPNTRDLPNRSRHGARQ